MTRARAAEVAEQLHIDPDVSLEARNDDYISIDENTAETRPPLGEITGNSLSIANQNDAVENKSIGKSQRRVRKSPNASTTQAETTSDQVDEHSGKPYKIMSESSSAPKTSTRKRSMDDLTKHYNDCKYASAYMGSGSSKSHDANAGDASTVQITHMSHLPTTDDIESKSPTLDIGNSAKKLSKSVSLSNGVAAKEEFLDNVESDVVKSNMPIAMQTVRSPSPVRLSTPQSQKSFNTVDSGYSASKYDDLEAAACQVTTPRSLSTVRYTLEDSVRANTLVEHDADVQVTPPGSVKSLDYTFEESLREIEILEQVVNAISPRASNTPTFPEKPESLEKPEFKKSNPVVRATKASQARISLAHGPKDAPRPPALGRPRQSIGPQDQSRTVSGSSADSGSLTPKKEVIIPHSKPRPMSMAFPAPAPLLKSTKAPTQSTFQLPGEVVAAKLKAAKEARLAKEAEESKKKPFKARPVPASLSKAPAVRQTNSSIAREQRISGKPIELVNGIHRPMSVADSHHSRSASVSRPFPPKSAVNAPSQLRSSTAMAFNLDSSSNSRPPSVAQSNRSGAGGSSGNAIISKGKEVYNRPAQLLAAAEQERREKEEATKKARAEAAARSRALSREWAEKQKAKKVALPAA
jgi:hypothetical protein